MFWGEALLLVVICVIKLLNAYGTEGLLDDLIITENFFGKLTNEYRSVLDGRDVTKELDEKIFKFAHTLQGPVHWRHKRHLEDARIEHTDNGVGMFQGFSPIFEDPFPNIMAISIFNHLYGNELQWFVATLNSSGISLYLYNGNRFDEISLYPIISGSGLITDCSELGCILIISKTDGGITVLRLKRETERYVLRPVQYLGGLGATRLSIWHAMNEMFLGIASNYNISIYHWLGEHFDLIQVLNYGTEELIPFKIGGSLYLAITGARSTVLRFSLQTNAFVLVQKLPLAYDVENFYVEKGHQREHYLVLSTQESTIIYKFVYNHFIPFQNIAKADQISSITAKETVILLALTKSLLKIYQYDGWKFVELSVEMTEVDYVQPTLLDGEIILIVRQINGTWKFNRLNWVQQGTWAILRGEIKSWCLDTIEKIKRQPPVVPRLIGPIRILRGHIGILQTKSINGRNTEPLMNLSDQFEELRSNLIANKQEFSQLMTKKSPKFKTLYAPNVSGKCKSGCKINNLSTSVKNPLLEKLARPNNADQALEFEYIKAQSIRNLRCPKPAVKLENITVSGTLNGITFESLRDDLLRVSGDQEITGNHVYLKLSASSALTSLKIATRSTQQELHVKSLRANSLHLIQGGILLPLNGQPVEINTTKTIAKVKMTGTVHLRCGINGTAVEHLAPLTWIEKPLSLWGNYSLQKVTIQNKGSALDLTLARARSLTQIINEAVHVDDDVPVHLKLSKTKTAWANVTADITENWITVSTDELVVRNITSSKLCLNDLTITDSSYEALPVPKFQSSICASEATISDIETVIVSVRRVSVETLKTNYIFGASMLNTTVTDTAISSQNVILSSKIFTGVVDVRNAILDNIDGINFRRLLAAMVRWRNPGLVQGSVTNASNLAVKHLMVPNGFAAPTTTRARNLITDGNIYFDTLNGVNISQLAQTVVKLDEPASLINMTFATGLIAETIETVSAPVDLSGAENMGVKIIAGPLKSNNLTLPYLFTYPATNTPQTLIIKGSASFAREPKIENVNYQNLDKLSDKIWLTDKPSILSNRIFVARDMVLEGPVKILGWLNSQSYGPWNEISNRLLSLTQPQKISTYVYLKRVTVPNIIGNKTLTLSVPEIVLDGLGDRSLKKIGSLSLTTDIHFQKLIILDDLNAREKINGRNLSTDVVRSDVKENIITGKKTVLSLHADNINGGLNFGKWQTNVLKPRNAGKPIYINGIKTFANITLLRPLRGNGRVNGRRIENYLLKSSPQELSEMKKVHGKVYVPEIIIDGLVNDIDLVALAGHQLKKEKPVQTIRTNIFTTGDVVISGNIMVNGLYHGVELNNLGKIDSDLKSVSKRMAELKNVAKGIQTALSRRAWYWNKLELIEVNSTILTPNPRISSSVPFEGLGSCTSKEGVLMCDNETVQGLIFIPDSSRILFHQVFELAGIPLVVLATTDPNGGVWIYTWETMGRKFHRIAGLNLPGATQASAIVTAGSLWLAVQLTWDTIILRYEIWGEFEEYTLPGADLFLMERAPTGELLIYRSDGVWRLGGLSGPHQLARSQLHGEISTFVDQNDYYVQLVRNNTANLLKTRYIGN